MTTRHPTSSKPTAHLDEWWIIRVREGTRHLVGRVSGHARMRNGARIVSSVLVALAPDRSWAEIVNTVYTLEAPGEGPLPDDWAERLDYFLQYAWGTARVTKN